MTVIRKKPLFEIYTENNYLIINNSDSRKDNGIFELESILNVELIRNGSLFNKIIEITFGFNIPAKSNELRINMENGFKNIILTDCNIEKAEAVIYEINRLILKNKVSKSDF
ncbi:hypothetical protein [Flavobacterium hungaricum]|uniref:PH domain-containing protein n=1 Tax=Flavobacterium hungaricum TaxID=2082725 RepID=A0ABR9TQA0_9FLAO|nr:hypothetical protein [Flavobacterium hungaricum]MBE8727516.1 hypothetical protein [Flavobacterium hungaricum]